jgi:NAD(P)-dependent dehydrogenase (short-subunit alcohol dehydrogenase family)
MRAEIPAMLKSGGGVIVNNSSVDGQRAFPWDPVYSAAKHGVLGLTKSAAVQYVRQGIRINAVCPSWIDTPPIAEMEARDPGATERVLQHQPIGRLGEAREVADAVIWLCSDGASFIVGTALAVDGGYLAV